MKNNMYMKQMAMAFSSIIRFKKFKYYIQLAYKNFVYLQTVLPKRSSPSASITVEAAMVLPVFIFFFVNILGAFNILKINCDMQAALHQTGNEVAIRAFDLRYASDLEDVNGIAESVLGTAYVSGKVKNYLGNEYLNNSCITGGASGISFLQSRIMLEDDLIDIVASYKVHSMIRVFGFTDFTVQNRYFGHAWTGYDLNNSSHNPDLELEEMVYVTEYGEVFHRDINCTHLKLSITPVNKKEVSNKRGIGGGKYHKCEYCGSKNDNGTLYITNYGDKYHTSLSCPGLKRTIYMVPISEVGGRGPCSKCG